MKYFKCKRVLTDGELYGLVAPTFIFNAPSVAHHFYDPPDGDIEIHGMDITQEEVADFLSLQHACCEVEQVEFAQVEPVLKTCRAYKEIDDRTVSNIRKVYDINRELSIIKLGFSDAQYIEMQAYIEQCRAAGRAEKVAIGLRLAE